MNKIYNNAYGVHQNILVDLYLEDEIETASEEQKILLQYFKKEITVKFWW
jgi:hypothetical protein